MSDVLVRQLQQVLAPWDLLENDSDGAGNRGDDTHAQDGASDAWGSAGPQDTLAHARAATTKLELARAALALFASNAGVFRPALVMVFRFLFDHIDELRDDVAQLKLAQRLWQQGEASRAAAPGPSSQLSGGTPDEQNAIVSAYEKVRMTESRMAALVEEASVQRDRFKSQIEAQKQQQYHLEDLLQHQMELTQTLLDHRLRQELVGGGGAASGAAPAVSAGEATHIITTSGGGGAGSGDGDRRAAVRAAAINEDGTQGGRRLAERRDAAYVQRLITRADRELTLEKTEEQLRDLRVQQDELERKVQSLLGLNSKYARQCVELSARLSIIHEKNIALAADVQLFQRDCVKEQQRSANLQHALLVARGIVLTTLQVQPGYAAEDMLDQLDVIDQTSANAQWRLYDHASVAQGTHQGTSNDKAAASTVGASSAFGAAGPLLPQLDSADEVEEALRVVPELGLRRQLQEVLQVDDVDHGGKIKAGLLRLLELETTLKVNCHDDPLATSTEAVGWLSTPCTHKWAPPYGLRSSVPRHLRSAATVPLLFLHPVLAEALVHELVTQRKRLLAFAQVQLERARKTTSAAAFERGGTAAAEMQKLGAAVTANSFVSFSSFIELFILVVWLNRADRYLPLLPAVERTKLEAEAAVREDAHARRVSRLVAAGTTGRANKRKGGMMPAASAAKTSAFHTSLWELRHVLHLVRPSTEAASLPSEGLQLTYALDVASQQTNAGPLTYAYGLTSRGTLCEVLFCVLRAERDALLSLCRAVDAGMTAHARGAPPTAAGDAQGGGLSSTRAAGQTAEMANTEEAVRAKAVSGWVPTVQLIRILLVLYPGYSVQRLEELIDAAVSDGTVGAERPTTLFYEVLLPGRLLPGPTTAATAADSSIAVSTKFARLFYAAICDDALASMQVVEDSVMDFVAGQQGGPEPSHGSTAGMGDVGGLGSATARQITANAFIGIPRLENQQWAAALRSAIHRWPRLRSTFADPGRGSAVAAKGTEGEEAEADQVSSVARVPTADVMPYLRQNIVVRRGLFANTETSAAPAASFATAASSPSSPSASSVADGWTPTQQRLLRPWETQWAQHRSHLFAASVPGPALFDGPSQVSEYVELLRTLDPYRTRPWGSELVSRGSAVVHPLNYADGWSDEALDIDRQAEADHVPVMALKKAMAKTGKKGVKKSAGAAR